MENQAIGGLTSGLAGWFLLLDWQVVGSLYAIGCGALCSVRR